MRDVLQDIALHKKGYAHDGSGHAESAMLRLFKKRFVFITAGGETAGE